MDLPSAETVPLEEVYEAVAIKAKDLGTQAEAALHWKCTVTMVNMVLLRKRRPTDAMLADVGLEKVASDISYRRVKGV